MSEENPSEKPEENEKKLSSTQKERIENNKLKALALRKSRVRSDPYQRRQSPINTGAVVHSVNITEDSRGGFMIPSGQNERKDSAPLHTKQEVAPALGEELMMCDECNNRFAESFLCSYFKLAVCDNCRDPDDKHSLITKTEAKETYLLKECDFQDHGGKPLEFLSKRNPHGYHGDMKLFLLCQVQERARIIWGSEDGLEQEKQRRLELREKKKEKNYAKQLKDLRSAVYSRRSIATSSTHIHEYGSEVYNPSSDNWTKTCKQCGQTVTFEKM